MSRYLYKKIQNISPESLNFQHSGLKLTTLGCDGTNENAGSDEMGWFNEWHQSLCGRNCVEREGIYVSRKGDRKAALYKDENKNC